MNSFPSSSGLSSACRKECWLSHRAGRAGSVDPALPHQDPPSTGGITSAALEPPERVLVKQLQTTHLELRTAMPALSKKVKLLHREFWEIKISKFQEKLEFSQKESSTNLPGSPAQCRAWHSPQEKSGGSFLKQSPSCDHDKGQAAAQSPTQGSPEPSRSTVWRGPGTGSAGKCQRGTKSRKRRGDLLGR